MGSTSLEAGRITGPVFVTRVGAVAAAVALLVLGWSVTAWAALPGSLPGNPDPAHIDDSNPESIVVYPTGAWSPTSGDAVNVQWAVDTVASGGTVFLKATDTAGQAMPFNFGTALTGVRGHITFGKSMTFQGEPLARDPQGGWATSGTTIKGGTTLAWGARGTVPLPSVIVKDIIFDGFRGKMLFVGMSQGYNEISGCAFMNFISGASADGAPIGAFPIVVHGGVELADIENVRGTLKVRHNFFGRPVKADGSPANLINNVMHFSNCDLDVEITENVIEDCVWAGLAVMGNKGHTVIARNVITKTRSYVGTGFAIGVGVYPQNSSFVSAYTYDGSVEITDNVITVGAPQDLLSTTNSAGILIGKYAPTQTFPGFPGVSPMPAPTDVHHLVSGNIITMYRNSVTGRLNPQAMGLFGDVSATTWTRNTVQGEATRGIQLSRAMPAPLVPPNTDAFVTDNTFHSNNLQALSAAEYQVFLDPNSNSNEFKDNDYGPGGGAGTYVLGSHNTFVNESFWGAYPGTMDATGAPIVPPLPSMWFGSGAAGNTVSAVKTGQALQGFDICTQVFLADAPERNNVNGYQKCGAVPESVKVAMVLRDLEFSQRSCEGSGGAWSGNACTCPEGRVLNTGTRRCEPTRKR